MRSNLLLALIVAFPLILNAQKNGRRGNSKWPALQELVIPDSLKDESAFYILNTTTIDFLETYETEVVVYKRIYVNSEKAAEEMNQKELFVSNGGRITMLQARTIKKDGSIIELDGEQIIETESIQKNKYGTDVLRRIQLIYPNVEKGDIIDLAYERSLDGYIFSDLMFLEDDLPSLRTKISLRNISRLDLTVYNLHGMPATKRSLEGGVETISWEKYGVNKRVSEDYSAIHPEASCGVFVLWKRGEKLDYKTIYSFDAYKYPETFGVFYKITERLQELGILEAEEQAFVALPKLIKAFENDFKWNVDESTEELKETIKFLSDKKVDDVLFLRYIMKYLSEQGIRYEKGFSKSLLDGRFEHGLVSLEQLSRRFLFIYDENDQVHFLFPPTGDGEFYYMDEIPFYLEGNQSIALYGDGDFLKETGTVAIPESKAKDNMHSAQLVINLESKTLDCQISRKDNLGGFYSLLGRNASSPYWLNQWGVSPDSIGLDYASLDATYPYQLKYKQDSIDLEVFEKIDDSLMWFLPEMILPLGIYEKGEQDSEYGDYLILPFLKKDRISIFVESNAPIQIAEEENELLFENEIGRLSMKTYQITDEVLKFDFEIEVKQRYIEGGDVQAFKEFLQQYSELTTKKWVISL